MRKMSNRVANLFSMILNIAIVFIVGYVVSGILSGDLVIEMETGGSNLRAFTILSNILCAFGALFMIPFNLATIFKNGDYRMPWGIIAFKFSGCVAVMITMLVCIGFLAKTVGFDKVFTGPLLFLHLVAPLLAFLGITIFDRGKKLKIFAVFFGFLPTVVYGTVYILMVVTLGKWEDFYGFNSGDFAGMWKTSFTFMIIAAAIVSFVMWVLNRIFCIRKGERKEQIEKSKQAKAKRTIDQYKEPQFGIFNKEKSKEKGEAVATEGFGENGEIGVTEDFGEKAEAGVTEGFGENAEIEFTKESDVNTEIGVAIDSEENTLPTEAIEHAEAVEQAVDVSSETVKPEITAPNEN